MSKETEKQIKRLYRAVKNAKGRILTAYVKEIVRLEKGG